MSFTFLQIQHGSHLQGVWVVLEAHIWQPAQHVQVVTSAALADALDYGHNREYSAISHPV